MLEVCCRWVEGSVEGKKRIERGEIEGIYSPEGMGAWTELAEGEEGRDSRSRKQAICCQFVQAHEVWESD